MVDVGDTIADSGLVVDNFSLTNDAGNPLPGSHAVTINLGEDELIARVAGVTGLNLGASYFVYGLPVYGGTRV